MKRAGTLSSTLIILLVSVGALAQDEPAPMMQKGQSGIALGSPIDWAMCAPDGIALGGFDVVSYRQPNGPVRGAAEFAITYEGTSYLFASQENRDTFQVAPQRYLPAYAGFCAITLALERVTCPDYTNFQIEGDRLLLFEVTGFTNGRTLWNSDPGSFREKADSNFEVLERLR